MGSSIFESDLAYFYYMLWLRKIRKIRKQISYFGLAECKAGERSLNYHLVSVPWKPCKYDQKSVEIQCNMRLGFFLFTHQNLITEFHLHISV